MKLKIVNILALAVVLWFVAYRSLATGALRMVTSYFCDLSNQSGGNLNNQLACAMYQHPDRLAFWLTMISPAVVASTGIWMMRMHRV